MTTSKDCWAGARWRNGKPAEHSPLCKPVYVTALGLKLFLEERESLSKLSQPVALRTLFERCGRACQVARARSSADQNFAVAETAATRRSVAFWSALLSKHSREEKSRVHALYEQEMQLTESERDVGFAAGAPQERTAAEDAADRDAHELASPQQRTL